VHVESRWCLRLFQGRSEDEVCGRWLRGAWSTNRGDDSDEKLMSVCTEQCLFIFKKGVE
jgi:hypothetical protein